MTGALPEVSIVRDGSWITGSDGIYYCTKPVAPKDAEPDNVTSELLGAPIKQENAPDGCHLEVTVLAESIQLRRARPWRRVARGQGRGR